MADFELPNIEPEHIGFAAVVGIVAIFITWLVVGYHTMVVKQVAVQSAEMNRHAAMSIVLAVSASHGDDAMRAAVLESTCPHMAGPSRNGKRTETMEQTVCQALMRVFKASGDEEKSEMLNDLLQSQKKDK